MSEKPILFSGPMVRALLAGTKTQTRRVVDPSLVEAIEFMGGGADNEPATRDSITLQWGAPLNESGKPAKREEWLLNSSEYPEEGCVPLGTGYGGPGDTLWVKETWADVNTESGPALIYRADGCLHFCTDDAYPVEYERYPGCDFTMWVTDLLNREQHKEPGYNWRTPIFMPRWASRLQLRVKSVRIERVQDISDSDAIAEGIEIAGRLGRDGSTLYRNYGCPNLPDRSPRYSFRTLWDSLNHKRGYGWDVNPWVWVYEFERVQ